MGRTERVALIQELEAKRSSKVLCYLTSDRPNASAEMQKDVMPLFYEHLRRLSGQKRIDVLLFTNGGDTLAAFGLSRLIREFGDVVGVLVPEKCYSAGTLFALGANEILMTRGATLSPIDPSVTTPLNPAVEITAGQRQLVPLSVESVAGFKALVTSDWGFKGEDVLAAAFKALADRVHPLALGDVFRARAQIELLASKLLAAHRSDDANAARIVSTLTKELGSHDYLISRTEARQLLGHQIAADAEETEDTVWALYRDFATDMKLGIPYDPSLELRAAGTTAAPCRVVQSLATVESATLGHKCEREWELSFVQLPLGAAVAGAGRGIRQELVRGGWESYS